MTTLDGFYLNPHTNQFDGSAYAGSNCTPTSGANGANAATGGKANYSGAYIRSLIPRAQETNPETPGWSLVDLERAMAKLSIPFRNKGGQGWAALERDRAAGLYVVLQGDSDRFTNATCSGAFDGDHAVGVHPATKTVDGVEYWWLDDPICKTGRWERESVLRDYAAKLNPNIQYGVFTTRVPATAAPIVTPPVVTLRYGATKLTPSQVKRVRVGRGNRAKVYRKPRRTSRVVTTFRNGKQWRAYQYKVNANGTRWFGNRYGTRWLRAAAFR